jgi:XrtJ-associated TM-motif-TM protein
MRYRWAYSILFLTLAITAHAHAQTGCIDSPECPTAVLAGVGLTASAVAKKFLASRRK